MFDTTTIYFQFHDKLSYNKAYKAVDNVTKLHPDKKDKNAYVTLKLADLGFQEIRFRAVKTIDYAYYAIEILLRPKLLVQEGNYTDVIYANEINKALDKFDRILRENLSLNVPKVLLWRVKRFDFAIDLKVKEDLIPQYIALFKRGNIPKKQLENPKAMKWFGEENNFYIMSDRYTINFYARLITTIEKQKTRKKRFTNLSDAKDLFRFEVQIKVDTKKMRREGKIYNSQLWNFLNMDLCRKTIEDKFDNIIGPGDYYKFNSAIKIIEIGVKSQRKRMDLLRLLGRIQAKGSIWAAKELYISDKKDDVLNKKACKKFSLRLNEIRNLGINPVILSNSFEFDMLKGLYNEIHQYFRNTPNQMIEGDVND